MESSAVTSATVEVGTLLADRYRVVRHIGSGGAGLVFEVEDTALNDERIALKLLRPNRDDSVPEGEMLLRFRNEAVITRRLAHPNIVRTFDFGQLRDGRFYLTMELVAGSTVEDLIRSSFFSRSNIHYITLVLTKIADAMQEAHKAGIMHRDLKSANVLISRGGEVKVTDFGLARVRTSEWRLTMTGDCVGTPVYMSPEQVQGLDCDHRVDIYALGVIAHEMVTGSVPFIDDSWYGLANKIVHEPVRPFANSENRVPPWFEEFVLRATKKDPDQRFASAELAATFLRAHLFDLDDSRHDQFRNIEPEIPSGSHVLRAWEAERSALISRRDGQLLKLVIALLLTLLGLLLGGAAYFVYSYGGWPDPHPAGPPADFYRPMNLAPPEAAPTVPAPQPAWRH